MYCPSPQDCRDFEARAAQQRRKSEIRSGTATMRVVIKVGTSLIAPGGQIDINLLRGMVDQFDLTKNEYLIVTSGAIAAGMSGLALESRPNDVPRMQACAAVGQSKLMHTYERLFFGKKVVAQLLLSSDDFTSPVRYRNLQNALAELLALGT